VLKRILREPLTQINADEHRIRADKFKINEFFAVGSIRSYQPSIRFFSVKDPIQTGRIAVDLSAVIIASLSVLSVKGYILNPAR
jgi:hypothetical protein